MTETTTDAIRHVKRSLNALRLELPQAVADRALPEIWDLIDQQAAELDALRARLRTTEQRLATLIEQDGMTKESNQFNYEKRLQAEAALAQREQELAECYRQSGADPDGNDNATLADHAVKEVTQLRRDSDAAEAELAALQTRLAQLEQEMRTAVTDASRTLYPRVYDIGEALRWADALHAARTTPQGE